MDNCKNVYITKSYLPIKCNLHQNSDVIIHRNRKNNPKGSQIAKANQRKKSNAGGKIILDFKIAEP
jgi:hypothetical protein